MGIPVRRPGEASAPKSEAPKDEALPASPPEAPVRPQNAAAAPSQRPKAPKAAQRPTAAPQAPSTKKPATKPPLKKEPAYDEADYSDKTYVPAPEHGPNMVKDKRTGKVYEQIPKTEMDTDGKPKLVIEIDTNELNGAADRFLSHLRVPPNKEEILRMREEARQRSAKREKEYAAEQEVIHQKYDKDDDEESEDA